MKANHIEVGLEAEIVIQSKSGEKRYPMTVYVAGAVEHYRVYDCVVNNENISLSDAIDADDFMEDILEEYHIQKIDNSEEY